MTGADERNDNMAKSMTFERLYDKLGKQPCRNMHETVNLKISTENLNHLLQESRNFDTELCIPLILKFSESGKPYFSAEKLYKTSENE